MVPILKMNETGVVPAFLYGDLEVKYRDQE